MATLAPDFQRIADSLLDQIKTFDHKVASRSVGTVSAVRRNGEPVPESERRVVAEETLS